MIELRWVTPEGTTTKPPTLQYRLAVAVDASGALCPGSPGGWMDVPLVAIEEETDECGHPCQPDNPCTECAEYWLRMVQDGYWDEELGRWTDKGWREIVKW